MEDLPIALGSSLVAVAIAALLCVALRRARRRLPLWLTRRMAGAPVNHPDPAWRRAVAVVVLPLEVAVCAGAAWFVSERLPPLHAARDALFRAVTMVTTSPLYRAGGRTYSLLDLLALPLLLGTLWVVVSAFTRVLETRWLQATGMNHGGRETIGMLARYALTLLGGLVLLQAWGVDVRTLAIAGSVLGVGIGFGLQNLANNFVSGVVISLERPIKPGDYVRVGEFQGTVERIGARSTEILTRDAISVLVPNSKLLEQEVVSWSHRDPTCRITIPVGVAYGSNVHRVRRALLEAARGHPFVIPDRPPNVDLRGFGESSLDFELEVWTREPHRQQEILSDLNYRVEAALARHRIAIPYPQRDLHLRSPELAALVEALARRHFGPEELAAARAALAAASSAADDGDDPTGPDPSGGPASWSDAMLDRVAEEMRAPGGLRIVDRRHRLKLFPRCFVGREAVDWLVRRDGLSREEAVRLGRILVDRGVFHHVLDEHTFHDGDYFYRFRADEEPIRPAAARSAPA